MKKVGKLCVREKRDQTRRRSQKVRAEKHDKKKLTRGERCPQRGRGVKQGSFSWRAQHTGTWGQWDTKRDNTNVNGGNKLRGKPLVLRHWTKECGVKWEEGQTGKGKKKGIHPKLTVKFRMTGRGIHRKEAEAAYSVTYKKETAQKKKKEEGRELKRQKWNAAT